MGSRLHLGYVPLWKSNVLDSGKSCIPGCEHLPIELLSTAFLLKPDGNLFSD